MDRADDQHEGSNRYETSVETRAGAFPDPGGDPAGQRCRDRAAGGDALSDHHCGQCPHGPGLRRGGPQRSAGPDGRCGHRRGGRLEPGPAGGRHVLYFQQIPPGAGGAQRLSDRHRPRPPGQGQLRQGAHRPRGEGGEGEGGQRHQRQGQRAEGIRADAAGVAEAAGGAGGTGLRGPDDPHDPRRGHQQCPAGGDGQRGGGGRIHPHPRQRLHEPVGQRRADHLPDGVQPL